LPASREQAKEITEMVRRCVVWILSVLLLAVLAAGGSGCKQEKEEAVQKETEAPETRKPAEEEAPWDTSSFEEEEGVEQENETPRDY